MEWLDTIEYLLNELAFVLSYSRIFVIAISAAFLIMFWGLIMINLNIHNVLSENKQLRNELEELRSLVVKGEAKRE